MFCSIIQWQVAAAKAKQMLECIKDKQLYTYLILPTYILNMLAPSQLTQFFVDTTNRIGIVYATMQMHQERNILER